MHYIYLNTYKDSKDRIYYYVGSHTWSGEGIDPNYYGSSFVAARHGWLPIDIKLLEVVSKERKIIAEREWIEHYCNLYGIADCALQLFQHNLTWVSKFRKHGKMLNLHANDAAKAREALWSKMVNEGPTELQTVTRRELGRQIQKKSVSKVRRCLLNKSNIIELYLKLL